MTTRSRHAGALARALTMSTGTSCRVDFDSAGDDGGTEWFVTWSDGPTETDMRGQVAEHGPRVAPLLAVERLRYERLLSDVGMATSLLWWLAQDYPGQEGPIDLWLLLHSGIDDVMPGYPENAPDAVSRRARVLIAHEWTPSAAGPIVDDLERHARGGWVAVAHWLDALDAAPNLAQRRAARPRQP